MLIETQTHPSSSSRTYAENQLSLSISSLSFKYSIYPWFRSTMVYKHSLELSFSSCSWWFIHCIYFNNVTFTPSQYNQEDMICNDAILCTMQLLYGSLINWLINWSILLLLLVSLMLLTYLFVCFLMKFVTSSFQMRIFHRGTQSILPFFSIIFYNTFIDTKVGTNNNW